MSDPTARGLPSTPSTPSSPSTQELLDRAHVVRIGLRTRFRRITERETVLLRGPAGWGEFGPFIEYDDAESARWLSAAIEAAWTPPPEPVRDHVPVNATVPAVSPDRVPDVLARYPGASTAKVKVADAGQGLADDVARVAAVRDVLGRAGRLRVDANGAWDVEQALDAVRALAPYDLEYVEQPCADVADLARVRLGLARAGLDVRVAADESIRRAEDPELVRRLEAADVMVVKVAPLGGVRAALAVIDRVGLPAVVSSALDTSVGIAAGVRLAAALPELPFACGLGTVALLEGDVTADPLVPRDGGLPVGPVEVDPDLLARHAAPPDRTAWWRDRLARCQALLT